MTVSAGILPAAVSISFFNSSFFIPMSSFDLFFVYFQNRIKCCKRKIVNRSYIRDRIIRDGRNRQEEHVHHWIRQIRTSHSCCLIDLLLLCRDYLRFFITDNSSDRKWKKFQNLSVCHNNLTAALLDQIIGCN